MVIATKSPENCKTTLNVWVREFILQFIKCILRFTFVLHTHTHTMLCNLINCNKIALLRAVSCELRWNKMSTNEKWVHPFTSSQQVIVCIVCANEKWIIFYKWQNDFGQSFDCWRNYCILILIGFVLFCWHRYLLYSFMRYIFRCRFVFRSKWNEKRIVDSPTRKLSRKICHSTGV